MGNYINFSTITMKFFAIAALFAAVEARHHHHHNVEYVSLAGTPPTVGLGHAYVPATREDYDNAKELWKGAQQCSQSWGCRGARLCERGGWCSGYDGCEG